jgi:hypothetical protein
LFKNFGLQSTQSDGPWQIGNMTFEQFQESPLIKESHQTYQTEFKKPLTSLPTFSFETKRNLVSHRAFAGHCGRLQFDLKVITALHVKESGSATIDLPEYSQGWDFYHISPPNLHSAKNEEELVKLNRRYAIPSKTLKGMARMMYSATHKGQVEQNGKHNRMNCPDADTLFGFVQTDTGYMGRLNFSFAFLKEGSFVWYGMPFDYPHPKQHYNNIRIFPHNELQVEHMHVYQKENQFEEDKNYVPCRCLARGSKFSFTIDFWNLSDTELHDLIWCIQLKAPAPLQYAHKIGKGKMLGLGSCLIVVNPAQSWEYNWQERYRGKSVKELGRTPIPKQFLEHIRSQQHEEELYKMITVPKNLL